MSFRKSGQQFSSGQRRITAYPDFSQPLCQWRVALGQSGWQYRHSVFPSNQCCIRGCRSGNLFQHFRRVRCACHVCRKHSFEGDQHTIYKPGRWVVRIRQENTDPRLVQCGENSFENSLIIYENLRTETNIGANTRPSSFRFYRNFWFDGSA